MKVYHYKTEFYESITDFSHGFAQVQYMLYIPKRALLGYRSKQIDFFSDETKVLEEAEKEIKTKEARVLDLPAKKITELIKYGKVYRSAKENFEKAAISLTELIEKE
jgi:selenocysteine-specific translation elongation factor